MNNGDEQPFLGNGSIKTVRNLKILNSGIEKQPLGTQPNGSQFQQPRFELPKEETFDERLQRLKRKQLGRQTASVMKTNSSRAQLAPIGKNIRQSMEMGFVNQVKANRGNSTVNQASNSNLLLATKQQYAPPEQHPYSKADYQAVTISSEDVLDPHRALELTQDELAEIYERPFMNPDFQIEGAAVGSNIARETEINAIEARKEKLFELFRQSQDVFDVLDKAKHDPNLSSLGASLEINKAGQLLFADTHFMHQLGEQIVRKGANSKKLELLMAKHLLQLLKGLSVDSQINTAFTKMQTSIQKRLIKLTQFQLVF